MRIVLLLLLPLLGCSEVWSADTTVLVDRVMLVMPGIREAQLVPQERRLQLYEGLLQVLVSGSPLQVFGSVQLWGDVRKGYWLRPVELGIGDSLQAPQQWRRVPVGQLALDTLLPLGASLSIWIRLPADGRAWPLLRVMRPDIAPRVGGYQVKLEADTLGLAMRAMQVMQGNGHRLAWREGKPMLMDGQVAELYVLPAKGIEDSSLVYRLLDNTDDIGTSGHIVQDWQATGHLLRLPALPAGKEYVLQVRYKSMQAMSSLQITVSRYWYQQPLWVGMVVLVLCALVVYGMNVRYRKRLRQVEEHKAAMQEQLRRLQLQLNPHFLYNALSSIAGLVGSQQYSAANTYLSQFGELLRQTIESSKGDRPFTLAQELGMMEKYCRLEQLRFGFRYSIEVDDCLDSESLQLPAMLIQPLVENAIRHGVQGLREAGFIRIVYAREGQDLVLSVSDNGPGLAYKATEGGTGTGLALTRLRIQYLQDLTGGPPIVFTLERLGSETVAKIRFTDWIEL